MILKKVWKFLDFKVFCFSVLIRVVGVEMVDGEEDLVLLDYLFMVVLVEMVEVVLEDVLFSVIVEMFEVEDD